MTVSNTRKQADVSNETHTEPPNERAAKLLADFERFLAMPDPLGPEEWESIRQHIKEHGLHIGSES
jgi:hypothetical protein